uniref:Uncharacterized protein n=1 Tax=Setaria viridis TaxID=4556 RepID=A0A4U6W907_SETVI|nr:hypothetical protein SEVIR_1G113460v2 [Setaria viridis]
MRRVLSQRRCVPIRMFGLNKWIVTIPFAQRAIVLYSKFLGAKMRRIG